MSTTTGNAASVLSKLEDWLQTEWPELKVFLTSITEQFATISINGPFATELMEKILKKMEKENSRFNISSTPTFVINDEHVIAGSLKYNEFVKKLKDFKLLN